MGVIDDEVGLSRGSGGGGRLKSRSPGPGWKGRSWAQPGVPGWRGRGLGRRRINPFWAAGPRERPVGRAGEAGMERLPQKSTVLPAWLWPRASSSHLPSRSLRASVFVPARGCPLPSVGTDTGSRGGLFLPQSESGGESGPRAACRRLGNRCERGVEAGGRGEGPSWGKTRGEIPRDRW